ncbi:MULTISPECIES: MalY/PatB family protein [Pelosinus]|jgi:cystathionine beta-lyase|uniref:cysteine-S-conjugate beta-lyase n=1 Tax=Pelosinus fermentans B4 TaxID=1149862 RepID=I9AWA3_9FIRM|nr:MULTISPECIES: PatB family C-S lyase [Pelosinus]EIW17187.1 aminotransferase class I and II [Pelosinus fermentans B4]EIW23014.1 aminotransferase class I and II [Pelosinus fermentans A11]OAM93945.1 Cystathionine beta-lyase [Pelosinus fermentans DSM 17108]SDQ95179.1 cystathione beta-lyase [Pelosinus fermentans]
MTNRKILFDFDKIIPRQGTGSRKWDALENVFGSNDVLPLWIADMDFSSPKAVSTAIIERANHPIYAYNTQEKSIYQSVIEWAKKRHGWEIEEEWILLAPGVVPSISLSIFALSEPGDGIIIQPPVYPPFFASIKDNDRKVIENPLLSKNGRYEIDFEDLEQKLAEPNNKLLLLCSPHNPVGRVWSREELKKVYELCQKYEVDVLADEIHNDLVFQGHKHTVFASLGTPVCKQSVTFMAASKTFNVAGLNFSFIIVPCKRRRGLIQNWITKLHISRNNVFGGIGTEAAYRDGEAWLDALLIYLEKNADTLVDFIQTRLPEVKVSKPEGTYLVWLDFRAYFTNDKELQKFLVQTAKVGLNAGRNFGTQGEGFARINIATQRSVLLEALTRIENALLNYKKI